MFGTVYREYESCPKQVVLDIELDVLDVEPSSEFQEVNALYSKTSDIWRCLNTCSTCHASGKVKSRFKRKSWDSSTAPSHKYFYSNIPSSVCF